MSDRATRRRFPQAERREQLLDVAEALFIEHGYAAVTMEDIARAAGVSRPVPYNHFGSREGAYIACVARISAQYNRALADAVDPAAPPKEQLRQGGRFFFSTLSDHQGRWSLMFASQSVLPTGASDDLRVLRFEAIAAIEELLVRSVADGVPSGRLAAASHAISGIGERLGIWWQSEPAVTLDEIVDHYVELVWAGVAPYAH